MRRRTSHDVEDTSGGGGEARADDTGRDTRVTHSPAGRDGPALTVGDHYDSQPLRGGLQSRRLDGRRRRDGLLMAAALVTSLVDGQGTSTWRRTNSTCNFKCASNNQYWYQTIPAKGIPWFPSFPPNGMSFHMAEGTPLSFFLKGIPRKEEEILSFLPWEDEGKERNQTECT